MIAQCVLESSWLRGPAGALVLPEPTLKHCLSLSAGLAVITSAAMYVLAYFLFTIHEEIGVSADAAFPLALWTCGPSQSCFWEASVAVWSGEPVLAHVDGTPRRNIESLRHSLSFKPSTGACSKRIAGAGFLCALGGQRELPSKICALTSLFSEDAIDLDTINTRVYA
jgi:hypothetical protein